MVLCRHRFVPSMLRAHCIASTDPFKTRTHQIELRQPPCNHKILCGLYIPRADALSTCFYFALEINFRWSESKCKVTVSTRRIRVTFCPVVPVRRTQVTVRRFLRSFLLIAGARRYSYSPWSFTGIFTRSGKSSAPPHARFGSVSVLRTPWTT